jgi:carotenoid cleavage dioxygenase-like enzyme
MAEIWTFHRYNTWSNQDNSIIFSVLKFTQHLTFEKLTKEVLTLKQNIDAKRMTSFSRQNLKNSKKWNESIP